jgi:hypothetical protein
MKKTSHIILIFLLCGYFLSFGNAVSGTPLDAAPLNSSFYAPGVHVNTPFFVKHSPLNFLFSFESFDHRVCRKPVFLFYAPFPSFDNLNYSHVLFKTSALGPNYLRVNENITFRNGNTFLLIPHSFTLPVNSEPEYLPGPTMTLPPR